MANSAFNHNSSITVPVSSTNTSLVRWSSTGADTFLDSTLVLSTSATPTLGIAADTDLLTFGNGTIAITGAVTGVTTITASGAVTGGTLVGTVTTAAQNSITTMTALTTVGTVGTGVWNGTAIITTYGGTGLASYTAGDMFYYASGTTLTKLAKGTADQVLTMNDGATAPGWETAAGGGTKEFFIPVTFGTGGITMIGDRPHTVLAQTQVAGMAFFVPHDYSSITNAVIVCRRGSADTNLDWDIFSDYAAIGQSYASHSEADTSTTHISSGIDNQLHEVNVAGILTSLAAGDHVGIRILNNEASSGGVHVLGLRFKYT